MRAEITNFAIALLLLAERGDSATGLLRERRLDKTTVPSTSPAPIMTPSDSPAPSPSPSETPTVLPTSSRVPSSFPSQSAVPSLVPSDQPSERVSGSPTDSPAPSPSPSIAPSGLPSVSSVPTTEFISMTDAFNVHLPDTDEEVDLEPFESAVTIFVNENAAPNTTFDIITTAVEVTDQKLFALEFITSFLNINFNITGNVGPRPVPDDFDFPYHVGYGFENNFTGFLATLEMENERHERGPPVVAGAEILEERQEENKLSLVAILLLLFLIIVALCLCCCICWKVRRGKDQVQDEVLVKPTKSEEEEEEEQEQDDLAEIVERGTPQLTWPPRVSNLHQFPFSNVHECKSAFCTTCMQKAEQPDFVEVTESKSWGARIAAALSPKSLSPRSWSTTSFSPRSWTTQQEI